MRARARTLLFGAGAIATLSLAIALAFVAHSMANAANGATVREVTSGAGDPPLRTSSAAFAERVAELSGFELAGGHAIEILQDTTLFRRLLEDLASARRTITFSGYYCRPGRLGDRLQSILADRAASGVSVFFLGDDFGCRAMLLEAGRNLVPAGVRVARFRPVRWHMLDRAQHRLHSRAVVIDGTLGYTGGFGIADKWVEDSPVEPRWRETGVRFTGPAVRRLQATFLAAWADATGQLLTDSALLPPPSSADEGAAFAGLLYSKPALGSTPAERYLAITISAAEKTLYLSNSYFVPTPLLQRVLVDAARRGVDVRLLVPGEHTDMPSARFAGRSSYGELLAAGVRIYEYQPAMMHAKTLVVDGTWAALGSLNLDNRSLRLNEESALVVHDALVGASMDSIFFADLRHSKEVTLESHARRPLRYRILEWLAARVAFLL